ncbi:BREX-1 system adenine-specific DNA-methyltransferase PglX [Anaerosolibacter sp.]|uniref:BREX-1 system adenine-specific DNA-methyltransferase PglX n=1 Tax=Anaerosolibacter sp. TaxID=1872527 RepID=UPI0039F0836E
MDKSKLKSFAIWARRELIKDVTYKAGLIGITEKEIKEPVYKTNNLQMFDIGTNEPYTIKGEEIKQRNSLVTKVKEKGFDQVVEEIAYTWFNRIIAIRYMEVNDYLPTKIRVLSSETSGKVEPDMVTIASNIGFDFTDQERYEIIPNLKHENRLDDLFKLLFIKQCNELNKILPELFEKTNDYSEILLDISFTNEDSIVRRLISEIGEEDYQDQVEIIGWLYQYYNEERRDQVINIYKGTVKKNDIPAATQLFTTDWVVRYMVDNSLGKYWIERNPNSNLENKLEYLVHKEIKHIDEHIDPRDVKVLDPCMGSGHILVYAFDVLMAIYEECGYSPREAAKSIIENNLYGLDIDDRAFQLAYFAVMMKGRSYNRRILNDSLYPNVCAMQESNGLKSFEHGAEQLSLDQMHIETANYLIELFRDAKELGSLVQVEKRDYEGLQRYIDELIANGADDIFTTSWLMNIQSVMPSLIKQAHILSERYDAVVTNPPYLNKMEGRLKPFVNDEYNDYSADLFSVFIFRNFEFCKENGYSAFMTPFVWMFIKSYEKLREYIINNKNISSLIQMEYSAFEEATVPICTFVLKNHKTIEKGVYLKLSDFKGGMDVQRQKVLEGLENNECKYFYETNEENFSKIPGSPIAYWVSENLLKVFENGTKMIDLVDPKQGLATADNNRFLRLWWEPNQVKIKYDTKSTEESKTSGFKWVPYNKGGERRQWYGNYDYVINWENDGLEVRNFKDNNGKQRSAVRSPQFYFKPAITWSDITSGGFSIRYRSAGSIHDVTGMSAFSEEIIKLKYLLGLMSTKISDYIFKILNPTIHLQIGNFSNFPVLGYEQIDKNILSIIDDCIQISKIDWDSFETSWEFSSHPMVKEMLRVKSKESNYNNSILNIKLTTIFKDWQKECDDRFNQLKSNEELLNRKFIEIYGLQVELTPDVENKDVTVRKADLQRDIKSFISYSVGCMFGRYSLNVEGLAYAGGHWDASKYAPFVPDKDNCIPITDEEYFEDDIIGRFVEFVKVVYGKDMIEENLDFIANALGGRGDTSRDIIRNYFIKDFFKDHLKTYQKRPIYWQFDSGKENGFKALIYMHRYNEDTVGTVRTEYLHKMQKVYESEIARMDLVNESSNNATEKARALKRKEKLTKQLSETIAYDAAMSHIALQRIPIDLDDGVKVNYAKFQDIEVSQGEGKKTVIVNLLSKI